MASDGVKLDESGVIEATGMNACGSYGVKREV